jgi:hypothetical protein
MEKSSSSSTFSSTFGATLATSLGFSATLALGAYPAPDIYLNL